MVELRIPGCVAGSVTSYDPGANEAASLTRVDRNGRRLRGRLTQLFKAAT